MSSRTDGRKRLSFYLILSATLLAWASSASAIKVGLRGYAPSQVAALRFSVGSLVLGALTPLLGVRAPRGKDAPAIFSLALFGVVLFHLLLNYGVLLTSASAAGFVANAPLFIILIAAVVLRERITRRMWFGLAACLAGLWLINRSMTGEFTFGIGCLALVGASLCYGLYNVIQKILLGRYTAFEVTCYFVWLG